MDSVKNRGFRLPKNVWVILCGLLVLAAPVVYLSAGREATARRESFAMDTVVAVTLYGGSERQLQGALDAAFAEIYRLEGLLSAFAENSDIYKINQEPARAAGHEVSAETYGLLARALSEAGSTGGAFDPTIGALTALWGVGTDRARVPSEAEIQRLLQHSGWQKVRLWKEEDGPKTVYRVSIGEGQRLDLGAIAKGYAADRAAAVLRERGVKSALLDLGGNLVVIGRFKGQRDWRLGIQDPLIAGSAFATVETSDSTLVTSGAYERYFEEGGVRYHHIIDPSEGRPSASDLLSATIIMEQTAAAENSTRSDALSTALFVMGFDRARAFLEEHPEVGAILAYRRGGENKIFITEGLRGKVSVKDGALAGDGAR